jgi:hypothetical protein
MGAGLIQYPEKTFMSFDGYVDNLILSSPYRTMKILTKLWQLKNLKLQNYIPLRNNLVFGLNIQNDNIAKNSNDIPKIIVNQWTKLLLDDLCKSLNFLIHKGSSFVDYFAIPVFLLYVPF